MAKETDNLEEQQASDEAKQRLQEALGNLREMVRVGLNQELASEGLPTSDDDDELEAPSCNPAFGSGGCKHIIQLTTGNGQIHIETAEEITFEEALDLVLEYGERFAKNIKFRGPPLQQPNNIEVA